MTNRLNILHHPTPNHNNSQSPPTERRDRNLALHPRQSRPLLPVLLQDAHAPQLVQHLAFQLAAHGVGLRVQRGELVRELAQGAGHRVVFAVVEGVLEVVALADGVFAVVVVGFVVVEVDFAEESVFF